jgi:hypothetical protein
VTIAYQQSLGVDSGAASGASLAYGSDVLAGSLLMFAIRIGGAGTAITGITDSLGSTWQAALTFGPTGQRLEIWYAMNSGAGPNTVTITASNSSNSLRWVIAEYSGLALAGALDQVNAAEGVGTDADTGTVTTTFAEELLVVVAIDAIDATPGAGYTQREMLFTRILLADQSVSSLVTTSGTATYPASQGWDIGIATFEGPAPFPGADEGAVWYLSIEDERV